MASAATHASSLFGPADLARLAGGADVDLWTWALVAPAEVVASLRGLLAPEERARADRRRDAADSDALVLARAGLRHALAAVTGEAAHEVVFAYGPAGKPRLAGRHDGLRFNLSHSAGRAVAAIGRNPMIDAIGIDIERRREVMPGLAARFFSAAEIAALAARVAAGDHPDVVFLRGWTRKEAVLKAIGCGLSRDPRSFTVSLDPPGAGNTSHPVSGVEADPAADAVWMVRDVDVGPEFIGALATRRLDPSAAGPVMPADTGREG